MGVQGLWELLSPVGRRVSVETLAGKRLAIDASIWMIQFMKAMRDDKGEMVRNAHLIGFFRRICKLMFLRAKPVFVFDGGTPALKRRTVIARRRMRENAQAKVRKTAEKLLLNHLKAMRLKELAEDLENQRKKNDAKGKKVINDEPETARNDVEKTNNVSASFSQEELDAMLAASLAAEEERHFAGNASTSGARISINEEEDDEDEDEEMILPEMDGKVDPVVLASLPPSMQLDLLVQMRERLMAENRQKYQKVKKAPAEFSELQIQSYLKTVAFRREINQVQKSAAGKVVGGVQTSRIASEANREFIFSSSFSGDKEALVSAGVEGHSKNFCSKQPSEISSALLDSISSTSKSNVETGPVADNPGRVPVEEIETFKDDRGHFRVSRVRAMGIRMTRDLQRNLDMIKEIEQDRAQTNEIVSEPSDLQKNDPFEETSDQATDRSVHSVGPNARKDDFTPGNGKLIEISFDDDGGSKGLDGDDDMFARLVAGDAAMNSVFNNGSLKKHSFSSDSDCDWEEVVEERVDNLTPAAEQGNVSSHAEGGADDSEIEWEDDDSYDVKSVSLSTSDTRKIASKGVLEEESELQEALRRSLKDLRGTKSSEAPFGDTKQEEAITIHETVGVGSLHHKNGGLLNNVTESDEFSDEVLSEVGRIEPKAITKKTISDDLHGQLATSAEGSCDITKELVEQSNIRGPTSTAESFDKNRGGESFIGEIRVEKSGCPDKELEILVTVEKQADIFEIGSKVPMSSDKCSADGLKISDMVLGQTFNPILADAQAGKSEAAANDSCTKTAKQKETHVNNFTVNRDTVQKLHEKSDYDYTSEQKGDEPEEISFRDGLTNPIQFTKAGLEEEIQNLDQEFIELGDQQRKLNRNVESVSSEMFGECQELLQMFGLPYIIAPMEAEAQCAYMELAGLVDGVVTDDSDAFLFGAKSVYKNIFDDRKYVETYFMKDIESELGLSRDKLIRMALLLGSDYTEGVSGIGIVNAIEVMNAFPEEDGFRKFREWIESPDPTILGMVGGQTGSSSKTGGSKVSDTIREGHSALERAGAQTTDDVDQTKRLFMDKHRNVSKNWHIPSTFPNDAVISAYASPEVDKSTEPFSWGKPDHFVLRKLCWEKFGWNVQKADDLLVPVLKEYNKRETQLRLEAFYTFNEKFAKIRSKRIAKAVRGIRGNILSELVDDDAQETSTSRLRRKVTPDKCLDDATAKTSTERGNDVTEDESNSSRKSTKKLSSKRKHGEPVISDEQNKNSRTRSNGRGRRGKGRGRASGRGRTMKTPELDSSESSDDGNNSDCEIEMQVEKKERPRGLRKSSRARKAVKYTLDDLENDELSEEHQQMNSDNNSVTVEVQSSKDQDIVGKDAFIPEDENQEKVREPSLAECSNKAYLDTGGGFCIEEADSAFDTSDISLAPRDDLSNQDEFPKEYLRVGGGFCLEEDGTNEEPVEHNESQDRYVSDGDQNPDPSEIDRLKLALKTHQGTKEDCSHMDPTKSLCAMPALKRKRRKG